MGKKHTRTYFNAWSYEADKISIEDTINTDKIIKTIEISEFLNTKTTFGNKFFIVAPKGLGKTLLLKAKSKIIREQLKDKNDNETILIPNKELCEKLNISPSVLNFHQIKVLESIVNWKKVWQQTIAISIACAAKLELPTIYLKYFDNFSLPTDILNVILVEFDKFMYSSEYDVIFHDLYKKVRQIDIPVNMFLDSLDQTLRDNLRLDDFAHDTSPSSAIKCWGNCQLAMMHVIHELCTSNRLIKIYASIRQEAYWLDKSETFGQVEEYASKIKYRKEDLLNIFQNNILATPDEYLKNPGHQDLFVRFLGINEIPHKFVPNETEKMFDFIYRHTLGRPRELLMIGQSLMNMNPKERTIENLREKVNEVSHLEIFKQFQSEIIPSFEMSKLFEITSKIKYNVFTRFEMEKIDRASLDYFYKLGLIGCAMKDSIPNSKIYHQDFRKVDMFNYDENTKIPIADFYFFHPAVDHKLMNHVKYSKSNIIGYGRTFIKPKEKFKGNNGLEVTITDKRVSTEPKKLFKIFISSANIAPERDALIYKLEKKFNDSYSQILGARINTVFWEELSSQKGMAQDIINKQLESCDIIVCCFKYKLGSPVREVNGKVRSLSGTVEELNQFLQNTTNKKAMVYFYKFPIQKIFTDHDGMKEEDFHKLVKENNKLRKFKQKIQSGLCITKDYEDVNDLLSTVCQDLYQVVKDKLDP